MLRQQKRCVQVNKIFEREKIPVKCETSGEIISPADYWLPLIAKSHRSLHFPRQWRDRAAFSTRAIGQVKYLDGCDVIGIAAHNHQGAAVGFGFLLFVYCKCTLISVICFEFVLVTYDSSSNRKMRTYTVFRYFFFLVSL